MVLASSSVSAESIAALVAVAVFVVAGAGGFATYFISRRVAGGRVNTSEASVLWQQAQDMRTMLLAEKEKAEEQRDRLIAAYTQQIFPVLTSINTIVQDMAEAVGEGVGIVRGISSSLNTGGPHEAAAPAPQAHTPQRRTARTKHERPPGQGP